MNVWAKGRIVEGLDPSLFRKDACGALIVSDKYGMDNPFGWEIDRIYPGDRGGKYILDNSRPLHIHFTFIILPRRLKIYSCEM